jgi:hypothetical protein
MHDLQKIALFIMFSLAFPKPKKGSAALHTFMIPRKGPIPTANCKAKVCSWALALSLFTGLKTLLRTFWRQSATTKLEQFLGYSFCLP